MNRVVLIGLIALILVGCAPSPYQVPQSVALSEPPAGFWLGLWHGIISPITFLVSLFNDSVAVYQVNNNGGWYNFGFLWGAGALTFGASRRSSK